MSTKKEADNAAAKPPLSPALLIVMTSVLLGLGARGISLSYAPEYSYRPDHLDFMAWSEEAWRNGPTNIYDQDEPWVVNYRWYHGRQDLMQRFGPYIETPWRIPHACNYLPGSTYIFWMQGGLWSMLDAEATKQGIGGPTNVPRGQEHTGRIANTGTARFVGGFPSIVFDFILAWGVYALVTALGGSSIRGAIAFALVMIAPPIFLDSAFWNQADAWVAAPLVWTTVWLVRKKFIVAGVVYGIALLLKPQAILLGPVLLFAAVCGLIRTRKISDLMGPVAGPIMTGIIALFVAFILAIPHSISAGNIENLPAEDKPWQSLLWFKRGYVDTVTGDLYPRTTLAAFNIWWLDFQRGLNAELEQLGVARTNPQYGRAYGMARNKAWDATVKVFGITKDALGKLLLAGGLLLGGFLAGRKWGWDQMSILGFAFVVMLCAFLLPTRVHERYIFLSIPFVIALATLRPLWLIVALPLIWVGTFEMTSFRWAFSPDHAGFSIFLSIVACLAGLATYVLLLIPDRNKSAESKA